ncbi:MAG: bifunctional metallophosphatase/5'-nucleotidase [Eubacteriaceae bacterium]|nr:bifunctional metallophosphatase/5'-nucleotidase [Eubacteriaceae bacterium]
MSGIKKLTLLHSNDLHGDFLPEEIEDGSLVGGLSMLSGYVKDMKEKEKNVIYAIAGDMFRGSVIDSEFKGISTIELINIISPDVVTLGNHETDYGVAHLLFIEKCAKFPIINSNLFIKTNRARLFKPYQIINVDGMNIMFIGVITEEVLSQTRSESIIGSFIDVWEVANEVGVICDNYRTTSVDLTVLLTHIGFDKDQELAKLIDPNWGVDLIIGGHTHTYMDEPCVVNGIPIVQAGMGTNQIGRFDIEIDTDKKQISSLSWRTVPISSRDCPGDPALDQVLKGYKSQTDEKYGHIITSFKRRLTHPSRYQETELGNLMADLMQVDSSFDVMLFGSGSIRKETLGPLVTYSDLLECCPYDDPIYMLEVTGEQLRRMLTFMLRDEAFEGDHTEFYQLSRGMRVLYDRKEHSIKEFRLNGKDIKDDDMIKIALQEYHYGIFSDAFGFALEEVTANKRPRMVVTSTFSILEELLSSSSNLDSRVEGRIEII